MKLRAVLVVLLLSSIAVAGCFDEEEDEPTATPTPPSTPATTTTTAPPTTVTTTTTAPPPPQQVFKGIAKYASPNEEKPFTVPSGAKTLEVKAFVNGTAATYSVQGPGTPPSGNPYVVVIDPAGTENKLEFPAVTSGTCSPSPCPVTPASQTPLTKTVTVTTAGTWKFSVRGTGTNVQADGLIMAAFA